MSNDTVVVGAPREDSTATSDPTANDGSDEGAAYVFTGFEAPKPPPAVTLLPEITVNLPSKPWVFPSPDPPVFRFVDLGKHLPGEKVEQVITLKNNNESELTGLSVKLKAGFAALPDSITISELSATTIPPGGSATFKFTFAPKFSIGLNAVLGVFNEGESLNSLADLILRGSASAPRQVDARQMFQLTENRLVGTGSASILGYDWGDLNGDNRLDVLVFGWQCHAFLNLPDGSFQQLSTNFGPVPDGYLADFDRDGDLDVFATLYPADLAYFENKGDLVFERKPENLPRYSDLPLPQFGHLATTLLDDNADGHLDVLITDGGGFQGMVPILLRNRGNGQFQHEADHPLAKAGTTQQRTAWIDINNKGQNDFLGLAIEGNAIQGKWQGFIFDGQGPGQFSLQGDALNFGGSADLFGSLGVWGDYDNDGDFDFVRAENLSSYLLRNQSGNLAPVEGHPFGPGTNPFWGDYDNDGLLDLVLTTLGSFGGASEQVQFYHNGGEAGFAKVDYESVPIDPGLDTPGVGHFGDEDNDGDLDFRLSRGADRSATEAKDAVLRNKGNGNAWLKIRLQGVKSNPHGIGAKVRVKATIRGQEVWQLRGIFSGGPTGLMPEAHFGLGDATTVDIVKIEWPSGIVQELTNVSPKQLLKIREAETAVAGPAPILANLGYTEGSFRLVLPSATGATYDLEYSPDLKNWTVIQSDLAGTGHPVPFADTAAERKQRRAGFYRARVK